MTFRPSPRLVVWESTYWLVNHRRDTSLPGYLMVASKTELAMSLADLDASALAELGSILASCMKALKMVLNARHVYCCRFGHEAGYSVHFHVIPVYSWMEGRFKTDAAYNSVRNLHATLPQDRPEGVRDYDGADMILYIAREYGERHVTADPATPCMESAIDALRRELNGA